ncbi:hypothetical protein OK18_01605 [Chryseobacterium gallinarum]|uniref:Uncharacterized protein n=1 Tax=Chryseobacterium gallinarum TaxID=1324352 RepID=A0A0G3LX69_CHRGL|nr:hypothetical protein OK18_01605 [Chryseobacterium gallinarum]
MYFLKTITNIMISYLNIVFPNRIKCNFIVKFNIIIISIFIILNIPKIEVNVRFCIDDKIPKTVSGLFNFSASSDIQ